jgi:hypothetical protein
MKQLDPMRFVLALIATLLCAGAPAGAASTAVGSKQAWFYSTTSLRASKAPILWCSFVTNASAKAAADGDRFWYVESGRLRYRGNAIESLSVMSESEDSAVEDSYRFGPDLAVKEVVRRGHYSSDPWVTATFRPDKSGHLHMTAASHRALQSWEREHATYFFGWPLYATFAKIPFAGLIHIRKSGITVSEACLKTKS